MPRSFDIAVDYDGSVEQVHRAFSEERYWLARLADSGADDATLDSLRVDDAGGVAVATTQVLRGDRLPAVVTQLHKGDLRIERRETWSPVTEGQATAVMMDDILKPMGKSLTKDPEIVDFIKQQMNGSYKIHLQFFYSV